MNRAALVAFGYEMRPGENFPVVLLLERQDSSALTERTGVLEGRQDGIADKIRSIGNATHRFGEGRVGFERDDLFSNFTHQGSLGLVMSGG